MHLGKTTLIATLSVAVVTGIAASVRRLELWLDRQANQEAEQRVGPLSKDFAD